MTGMAEQGMPTAREQHSCLTLGRGSNLQLIPVHALWLSQEFTYSGGLQLPAGEIPTLFREGTTEALILLCPRKLIAILPLVRFQVGHRL